MHRNYTKEYKDFTKDFYLNSSVIEGGNVIVTSFLRATSTRRTPTPVTIIKKDELQKLVLKKQ